MGINLLKTRLCFENIIVSFWTLMSLQGTLHEYVMCLLGTLYKLVISLLGTRDSNEFRS